MQGPIGHAYFTNGYLLRGELRPMCSKTRLTVRHVLLGCAKYAHIRRKHFSFNSLFELFMDTPAGFIIQFLRECNLFYMFDLLDFDKAIYKKLDDNKMSDL